MSDLWNGWTVSGTLAALLTISGVLWRRVAAGSPKGPSLYRQAKSFWGKVREIESIDADNMQMEDSLRRCRDGWALDRVEMDRQTAVIKSLREIVANYEARDSGPGPRDDSGSRTRRR